MADDAYQLMQQLQQQNKLQRQKYGSVEPYTNPKMKRVKNIADMLQAFGLARTPRDAFRMANKMNAARDTVGEFLPGTSYELAKERNDKLGQGLAMIDLIPGGGLLTAPVKVAKKVKGTVQYNKLYHGSPEKNLKEVSVSKSKRSEGFMPHISATENPLLAKAFTRGELGDRPMGQVYESTGNFNLIDLGTDEGKKIWNSLDKKPEKALDKGFDGVQLSSHYEDWKQPFYKDVDFSKLKNAKEIQLFKNLKVNKIK